MEDARTAVPASELVYPVAQRETGYSQLHCGIIQHKYKNNNCLKLKSEVGIAVLKSKQI